MQSEQVQVADEHAAVEMFFRNGWSDGLPVVSPTPALVLAALEAAGLSPEQVLGGEHVRRRALTAEKVAINAVMAGCTPELFPVVVSAVQALTDSDYGLHGNLISTGGAAPLMIVSGPVVEDLEFNSGTSAFGPGFRANATVGRAIRLILQNVLGARPGDMDQSILGHPGKYGYLIAEDAANPWQPFHVDRGYEPEQSTVTVMAAWGPIQVDNQLSRTAEGVLNTIADAMSHLGTNNIVWQCQMALVLCPDHAQTIADNGWTKQDVKRYLQEHARRELSELVRAGRIEPPEGGEAECEVSVLKDPDDLLVVVAGGRGAGLSAVVPGWADLISSRAVTRMIGVCEDCLVEL